MLRLAIACAAGALIVILATRPAGDGLPEHFRFVCVATGEFFDMSVEEAAMIPARNPRTGELTLVLCVRGEAGDWRVADDQRGILEDQLATVNQWVDPGTLQIRAR